MKLLTQALNFGSALKKKSNNHKDEQQTITKPTEEVSSKEILQFIDKYNYQTTREKESLINFQKLESPSPKEQRSGLIVDSDSVRQILNKLFKSIIIDKFKVIKDVIEERIIHRKQLRDIDPLN